MLSTICIIMLKKSNALLYEMIAVMGLTVIFSFLYPEYKSLITLSPLIYLLIERKKSGRSWNDIGFKFKQTLTDLKNNWYLVILVVIVTQVLTLIIGEYFFAGFLQHIQTRIPLIDPSHLIPFMIMLFAATLGEELIFRVFFQKRLNWYIGIIPAILISSAVFSSLHYASGPLSIISFDIITIFIDSIIYGIIYYKTKNVFAAWIPHLLADVVAIFLIVNFLSIS